jgi:hypothetical protein
MDFTRNPNKLCLIGLNNEFNQNRFNSTPHEITNFILVFTVKFLIINIL